MTPLPTIAMESQVNTVESFRFRMEEEDMGSVSLNDLAEELLQPNGWLSDSLVDNYLVYMRNLHNPKVGIYPSANCALLANCLSGLKPVETEKFRLWLLPICYIAKHGRHWFLLSLNVCLRKCIVYNCLKASSEMNSELRFDILTEFVVPFAHRLLNDDKAEDWTVSFYDNDDIPKLNKPDDSCGIFVISYAESLLKNTTYPEFPPSIDNLQTRVTIAVNILLTNQMGANIVNASDGTFNDIRRKVIQVCKSGVYRNLRPGKGRQVSHGIVKESSSAQSHKPGILLSKNTDCIEVDTNISSDTETNNVTIPLITAAKNTLNVSEIKLEGTDESHAESTRVIVEKCRNENSLVSPEFLLCSSVSQPVQTTNHIPNNVSPEKLISCAANFKFGTTAYQVNSEQIGNTLLIPNVWLADEIVDNYMCHLRDKINPQVTVITSMDVQQFSSNAQFMEPVRQSEHFLINICTRGHWYLVHANLHRKTFVVYNSLRNTTRLSGNFLTRVRRRIDTLLAEKSQQNGTVKTEQKKRWKETVYVGADLPQQPFTWECGIYVLIYGESVLHSTISNTKPVFPTEINNKQVRLDIAKEMLLTNDNGRVLWNAANGNMNILRDLLLKHPSDILISTEPPINKEKENKHISVPPSVPDLSHLSSAVNAGQCGQTRESSEDTGITHQKVAFEQEAEILWEKNLLMYMNTARLHFSTGNRSERLARFANCIEEYSVWISQCNYRPSLSDRKATEARKTPFYNCVCVKTVDYSDIFHAISHALTGNPFKADLLRAASFYHYERNLTWFNGWFGTLKHEIIKTILEGHGFSRMLLDLVSRAIGRVVDILICIENDWRFTTRFNPGNNSQTPLAFEFTQLRFTPVYINGIQKLSRSIPRISVAEFSTSEVQSVREVFSNSASYYTNNNIQSGCEDICIRLLQINWTCTKCVTLSITACEHNDNDQSLKSKYVRTLLQDSILGTFHKAHFENMIDSVVMEKLPADIQNYVAIRVNGDGNCFWSAISTALVGDPVLGKALRRAVYWDFKSNLKRNAHALRNQDLSNIERRLLLDESYTNTAIIWLTTRVINRKIYVIERINDNNLDAAYIHHDVDMVLPPVFMLLMDRHFSPLVPSQLNATPFSIKYTPAEYDPSNYNPQPTSKDSVNMHYDTVINGTGQDVHDSDAKGMQSTNLNPNVDTDDAEIMLIPSNSIHSSPIPTEGDIGQIFLIETLRKILSQELTCLDVKTVHHVVSAVAAQNTENMVILPVSSFHLNNNEFLYTDADDKIKDPQYKSCSFLMLCDYSGEYVFIHFRESPNITTIHVPELARFADQAMIILQQLHGCVDIPNSNIHDCLGDVQIQKYKYPKDTNLSSKDQILYQILDTCGSANSSEVRTLAEATREKICNDVLQYYFVNEPNHIVPYISAEFLNLMLTKVDSWFYLHNTLIPRKLHITSVKTRAMEKTQANFDNFIFLAKQLLLRDHSQSSFTEVIQLFLFANKSLGRRFIKTCTRKNQTIDQLNKMVVRILYAQRDQHTQKKVVKMLQRTMCPESLKSHYQTQITKKIATTITPSIRPDINKPTKGKENIQLPPEISNVTNQPESATIQLEAEVTSGHSENPAGNVGVALKDPEHLESNNEEFENLRDFHNVSQSVLTNTTPHVFASKIPRKDYTKLFNETTSKLLVGSYPYIISKVIQAKMGCIMLSKSSPTYYTTKNSHRFGWCKVLGYCHCGIQFRVQLPLKPLPSKETKIRVYVSGAQNSFVRGEFIGRPCNGLLRRDQMKRLKNTSAYRARLVDANREGTRNPRAFIHGTSVNPLNTYKKIRHEAIMKTRKSNNPRNDIDIMKRQWKKSYNPKTAVAGYVQTCDTNNQLKVHLFSYQSLTLLKQQKALQKSVTLHVDATGGVFKQPVGSKLSLLYLVIAKREDGITWPLAEMINDRGTVTEIAHFLSCIKDNVKVAGRIADIVCTDFSYALIHATVNAFNFESIDDYIERCYNLFTGNRVTYPSSKVYVFICTAHLVNAFKRNLRKKVVTNQRRVLDLAQYALARLQEAGMLEEISELTKVIVRTFGAQNISTEELEAHKEILTNTGNFLDYNDPGMEELFENPICEDETYGPTIRERSKFYQLFRSKREATEAAYECSNAELPENPYYCPDVILTLENTYIPMLPFWNGDIICRHHNNAFLRETSAVIESEFRTKKLHWKQGRYPNYADYVRDSFTYHKARVLLASRDLRKPSEKLRPYIKRGARKKNSKTRNKNKKPHSSRRPSKRFTEKNKTAISSHINSSVDNNTSPNEEEQSFSDHAMRIDDKDLTQNGPKDECDEISASSQQKATNISYSPTTSVAEISQEADYATETWSKRKSNTGSTSSTTQPNKFFKAVPGRKTIPQSPTILCEVAEPSNPCSSPESVIQRGGHTFNIDEINSWMSLLPIEVGGENSTIILNTGCVQYGKSGEWILDKSMVPNAPAVTRLLLPLFIEEEWVLVVVKKTQASIYSFHAGYNEVRFKLWDSNVVDNLIQPLCVMLGKSPEWFEGSMDFATVSTTYTKKSESAVLIMIYAERMANGDSVEIFEGEPISTSTEQRRILRCLETSEYEEQL